MASTTELLDGFATTIAAAGLASWNPTGVYTSGQTGIFRKILPADPDRAIALTLVNTDDDVTMPLGQKMLQVKGRGVPNNPTDVDDLLDSIFDILHGATGLVFGGQTVIQCLRRVSVPMGMDEASHRWERLDQYYLDVDAAPTANRPEQGAW